MRDHGVDIVLPPAPERDSLHYMVIDELARGHVTDQMRTRSKKILERLRLDGAEVIVLGCTEYGLLDSAEVLAQAIADRAAL